MTMFAVTPHTVKIGSPDGVVAERLFREALALQQIGDFFRAQALCREVLGMQPAHFEARHLIGVMAAQNGDFETAISFIDKALAVNPQSADAWNNRGYVLRELKRPKDALLCYKKAIALDSGNEDAYYNSGLALQDLYNHDAAIECYDRAIALKPDYVNAYNNRGIVYYQLRQYADALLSYNRALAINPQHAEAFNNKAEALYAMKRKEEALPNYQRALELNANVPFLFGMYMLVKMNLCDWNDYDAFSAQLCEKLSRRERTVYPFGVLAIADSPALQQVAAEILVEARFPASDMLLNIAKYSGHEKIRIGYYSADFYDHATACLMADMFERHDRSKFEFTAFSFGPDVQDHFMRRVSRAFDRFVDVRNLSDAEVAEMSRVLEIDIAVDLKGYTTDARTGIFALRAAPIQVNYLGYPGTMGADYIDYIIADQILIPEHSRAHFTEKIVYLPDSYQVNDSKRVVSDKVYTREELGLPEKGFVFCCFNNNYKITPQIFACWMRILEQVEGSVLWLLEDNGTAAGNLRMEAVRRGIDPERLFFAGRFSIPEHLARQKVADLFLDTCPCNAHTTASDALWVGLPILTLIGETFASRVAASLLEAIHLPELIAKTAEEYETLAVELALHPNRLKRITQKLKKNRLTTPLFNTERFTRKIEEAYTEIYKRYQNNLVPEHIHISP